MILITSTDVPQSAATPIQKYHLILWVTVSRTGHSSVLHCTVGFHVNPRTYEHS